MTKRRKDPFDILDDGMDALDRGLDALDETFDSLGDIFDSLIEGDGDDKKLNVQVRLQNVKDNLKGAKDRAKAITKAKVRVGGEGAKKHRFTFTYQNRDRITVEYNSPTDYRIETTGNLDRTIMDAIVEAIKEDIRKRKPSSKQERVRDWPPPEESAMDLAYRAPTLWTRDWRGMRKAPLEFTEDSKVVVEAPSLLDRTFDRKYVVKVDGSAVYFIRLEQLMEEYANQDDIGPKIFINGFDEKERGVLLKIFEGLKQLGIYQPHHQKIEEALS